MLHLSIRATTLVIQEIIGLHGFRVDIALYPKWAQMGNNVTCFVTCRRKMRLARRGSSNVDW